MAKNMKFYFLLSFLGLTTSLLATTTPQTNPAVDQKTVQPNASPQAAPTENDLEQMQPDPVTLQQCIKSAKIQAWHDAVKMGRIVKKGFDAAEKLVGKGLQTAGNVALGVEEAVVGAGAAALNAGFQAGKAVYQAAQTTVTNAGNYLQKTGQAAIDYGQKKAQKISTAFGNSVSQTKAAISSFAAPVFLQNIKGILKTELTHLSSIAEALKAIQRVSCQQSGFKLVGMTVVRVISLGSDSGEICQYPIVGQFGLSLCEGYEGFETRDCYPQAKANQGKPATTVDRQAMDIIFQSLEDKFGVEVVKQFFESLDTTTEIDQKVKKIAQSLKAFYEWRNKQNEASQNIQSQSSQQIIRITNTPITTPQTVAVQ